MHDLRTGVVSPLLQGIRVLEYGGFVSAPYCGKLLAQLGAEVVKIQHEKSREASPCDTSFPEYRSLYLYLDTSKKGITLDLETGTGKETFLKLAEKADILVDETRPGFFENIGLGYMVLCSRNPGMIQTSITPFGQTGPYRDYKAYYLNTFHSGGEGYITPGGLNWLLYPDREPLKAGGFIGEYESGVVAAIAALGALYGRRLSGQGQYIDVSKQEALLSGQRYDLCLFNEGWIESRASRMYPVAGLLQCRDGFVEVLPLERHMYDTLMKMIGKPEWVNDERYQWSTITQGWIGGEKAPLEDRQKVNDAIELWMLQHTKEEIYTLGQASGCAIGKYHTVEDLLNWEQLKARQFFTEIEHPATGRIKYPGAPYRFSRSPVGERRAPLPEEHNHEVHSGWLKPVSDEPARMGQEIPRRRESGAKGSPLAGVRVADFSSQAAGPFATELLAFLGAEVIRIESRLRPDVLRQRSNTRFNELNLNKMGITLNLKQPRAQEIVKNLVRVSDVVVENFRPGVMQRLGLGYEVLSSVKPDLIMLSLSGFGQDGPECHYAAYAPIFAALAGLGYITGYPDGIPTEFRGSVDLRTGELAAFAVLAALVHRQRTGEGQYVDFSAIEGIICLIGDAVVDYAVSGRVQGPKGNRDDFMAPHNCYPCRGTNRWVSLAIATEAEWKSFCHALGDAPWTKDPRFCGVRERWQHQDELDKRIAEYTRQYTDYEVMEIMQRAGVAAIPSFDAAQLRSDAHLWQRGFFVEIEHPELGRQYNACAPWKFSNGDAAYKPAPVFGQHNAYVLGSLLGMTSGEIEKLVNEKIVY